MGERPESSGERRLDRLIRTQPVVVYSVLALFLLTTLFGLVGYAAGGWRFLDRHYFWRDEEYARLESLHSDYTVERFEEVLGAPLLRRRSSNGRWLELFFRRRDYWVQAVVPVGEGVVRYFSVTSCSTSFTPTLELPDRTHIKLYRKTLRSVGGPGDVPWKSGRTYRYVLYVSSPSSFMEWVVGPHSWKYKAARRMRLV